MYRLPTTLAHFFARKFTEQDLGMIKTVYPDAYELKYELVSPDETMDIIIELSKQNFADMNERKKTFHVLLLDRTKLHHEVKGI